MRDLLLLGACATTTPTGPRESVHGLTVVDIDGQPQPLAQYGARCSSS